MTQDYGQQYIDLYKDNLDVLGYRPKALEEFERESIGLSEDFAPDTYGVNLRRLALPVDVNRSFKCAVPTISAAPALMVNDYFQAPARLPEGVEFVHHLDKDRAPSGVYDALCSMLATDGALLRVKAGVNVEKPLQLVNILSSPVDLLVNRRLTVVMEPGSSASLLVCDHTQDEERNYLVNELIDVKVMNGATLTLDRIEESSAKTIKHSCLDAVVDSDGVFNSTASLLACGKSVNTIIVELDAPGSVANINGMVIASGSQEPAINTYIQHGGHHTSSSQVFKYVADGESKCRFNGLISVLPGAEFTDARQINHNLLASTTAKMHTEPTLEIYCDEVKCSHGATTGQLDADALFYMRSRGIPEAEARQMLMEAFLADVISHVGIDMLRDRLRHLLQRRFSSLESHCGDCSVCQ